MFHSLIKHYHYSLQRMHYEISSTKKKRIILSTQRKSRACRSSPKQSKEPSISLLREFKAEEMNQSLLNYGSINNSLEIFQDDPKNRHFHLIESQEERLRTESNIQLKERSMTDINERADINPLPNCITNNKGKQNFKKQGKGQHLAKIETIHVSSIVNNLKSQQRQKIITSPNRRYIDLTLKRTSKHKNHQSASSLFLAKNNQNPSITVNKSIFESQRGILSSVSVNSLQFTVVSRTVSQRKKALTITCHKYNCSLREKTAKEEMNKNNSIKLFIKGN